MLPPIKILNFCFLIFSIMSCFVACGTNHIAQSEITTVIPMATNLPLLETPIVTPTSSPTPIKVVTSSLTPTIPTSIDQQTMTLAIDTPSLVGQPGKEVTLKLRFKNNGSITDTLSVELKVSQPEFYVIELSNGPNFYIKRAHNYDRAFVAPPVGPHQEHIEEIKIRIPEYVPPVGTSITTLLEINGQKTPLQFTTLISGPTSIETIKHIDHPVYAIAVSNQYAYLADGKNGLRILDISDPIHPVELGLYDKHGGAWNLSIVDNYAYVIFGTCKDWGIYWESRKGIDCITNLYVIDISNPSTPVEVSFYELSGHALSSEANLPKIITSSNYAYLIDDKGSLHILDISNPAAPIRIDRSEQNVEDITLDSDYVYLLYGGGFKPAENELGFTHSNHLDILDSTSLSQIGTFQLPTENPTLGEIFIVGERAYISWGVPCLKDCTIKRWLAVDISNPTTPHLTDKLYYDRPLDFQDMVSTDDYVYIADGIAGLRILNALDPANLVEVDSFGALGKVLDVAVSDGYIYLANGSGGLYILRNNR